MRNLLLFPIVTLLSCSRIYVPPSPPTYDDTCTPSDDFYAKKASSTRDIAWALSIPDAPQEAFDYCTKLATDRGWVFAAKGADAHTTWGRFTTTLPGELPVILLGKGFYKSPIAYQAEIVCHEVVHTFQWERDTLLVMGPTYILNEGTLSYETPAHLVSMGVWRAQHPNATDEQIEKRAVRYTNNLWDGYGLDNNLPECLKETTVAILVGGIG